MASDVFDVRVALHDALKEVGDNHHRLFVDRDEQHRRTDRDRRPVIGEETREIADVDLIPHHEDVDLRSGHLLFDATNPMFVLGSGEDCIRRLLMNAFLFDEHLSVPTSLVPITLLPMRWSILGPASNRGTRMPSYVDRRPITSSGLARADLVKPST